MTMKTIGLIGGVSWESSSEYYRIINESTHSRLGGLHSAKSVMVSVDFAEVELLQREGRWDVATQMMVDAARQVERGGAELLVICSNTMHKMADEVQAAVNIPLLHIVDATAEFIKKQNIRKVGLLGTRFTMEEDFYKMRLIQMHGLEVLLPDKKSRDLVDRVIFTELVVGIISPESKTSYLNIIDALIKQGAQGVILGCTEIGMLVKSQDRPVPLFDTTWIHAQAAVEAALIADF
jgi:aspartate racemase